MSPSWKSLLKKRYLIGLILFLLFLGAVQAIISYIVNLKASSVAEDLSEAFQQKVSIRGITFGIFKGIEIEDLSSKYLKIEKLQVRLKVLTSIGNKKITVGKVIVIKASLHIPSNEPGFSLFNIFDANFSRSVEDKFKSFKVRNPFPSLIIHDCEIVYGPVGKPDLIIDLKGVSKISGYYQFKSKGTFVGKKDFSSIGPLAYFFPEGVFKQDFGYEFETWQEGKSLVISGLKIRIGFDSFTGQARITDFMDNGRRLSLELGLDNFSLENITSLKEPFSLTGPLTLNLFLDGPIGNPAFRLNAVFSSSGFKDTKTNFRLNFKSGSLILTNKSIELKDAACLVNDRSFKADVDYSLLKDGQAYFSSKLFDGINSLEVKFNGIIAPRILSGNLDFAINTDKNYKCLLDNFSLRNGLVAIGKLKLSSSLGSQFMLENIKLNYLISDNYLKLDKILGYGYGGILYGNAQVKMRLVQSLLDYNLNLELQNMDMAKLQKDLFNKQTLSGIFKADIFADSNQEPALKIHAKIQEGIVQNEPLLDDLADFMRFDAIRNIPFQDVDFSCLDYSSGDKAFNFNLTNPDMLLVSKFNTDNQDNLKGYLSVLMYKNLLEKSDNFRRLLNFVKEKSNSLTFEFDLGGKAGAPRFLWRKSEFRTKLTQQLPGFIKRSLEESINEEINNLFIGN